MIATTIDSNMDSASSIANRTAGKQLLSTGENTFGEPGLDKAEHFAFDWLGGSPGYRHRESHHPSATGYRQL